MEMMDAVGYGGTMALCKLAAGYYKMGVQDGVLWTEARGEIM